MLYTARNYRLSRRGQVTDRFTIALERLGSSELYVRIGGVHALEHVMRDSADHHNDVIEVLTEFIRHRAPRCARQSDRQVWMHPVTGSVPDLPAAPTPDIQAALTTLAHRPRRPQRLAIDLTGLHLTGATLYGANLTGAWLAGADLARAWLGGATLSGAQLAEADLAGAWLADADLTGAILVRANLSGANLSGANFTRAHLDGANFTRAQLPGANFTRAQLPGANFTGAHLGVGVQVPHPPGANFTGAHLVLAWLPDANLSGANLDGAVWPPEAAVPEGWERDADGRLTRSSTSRVGGVT